MKRIDLAGRRFGAWTVLAPAGANPNGHALWACRCGCGYVAVQQGAQLRRGATTQCRRCQAAMFAERALVYTGSRL